MNNTCFHCGEKTIVTSDTSHFQPSTILEQFNIEDHILTAIVKNSLAYAFAMESVQGRPIPEEIQRLLDQWTEGSLPPLP